MIATVDSKITIRDATPGIAQAIKRELTLANPAYAKAARAGRWTGNIPKTIALYERQWDNYVLPFGCLKRFIIERQEEFDRIYNHTRDVLEERRMFIPSRIKLYDYQEDAVHKAYSAKNGIIVSPCGTGKTEMGLELAAIIGGRTLWITHTEKLLKQSMERAKARFNLLPQSYGTITDGKIEVGKVFTFATIQTLSKVDLSHWEDYWQTIIVDECHHCVGSPTRVTMYYRALAKLNARNRYGLTATPFRADGLIPAMFALLGDTIVEIPRSVTASKTVPIHVIWRETGYAPDIDKVTLGDGTLVYSSLIKAITSDDDRNALIVEDITTQPGPTLVLSERLAHLKKLMGNCAQKKRCVFLEDAKTVPNLENGNVDVVFATYQLAREGLDCPALRTLIMASPIKDKGAVTQAVGRVMRKAEGKDYGVVIDYSDAFSYFRSLERKRRTIYGQFEAV